MKGTVLSIFAAEPQRIGGVETFARELSRQLDEAGWQSVLCFVSDAPPNVSRFLAGPNVTVEVLPGTHGTSWRTLLQASALLKKYHPRIVHTHFTLHISPLPWLARFHSVSLSFFTDHISRCEGHIPKPAARWKQVVSKFLNQPLTNLIAVSDYNARICAAAGFVATDRVTRIYNGVDLDRCAGDPHRFRRRFGIPDDRTIVLQVSWMIAPKGIEDLLDAARLVLAQNPRVQFVLVGEGANRSEFMALAQQKGLADHVTWTGLVGDPIGDGVYAAASIVCQLSRWREAFGWTITEAMACGKPVIATSVGGIPEIIVDGVSGFLVGCRQPGEAATRILQLLRDPELGRRMGQAGRLVVEDRFNLRRNVAELLRLYGIRDNGNA